MSRDRSDDVPYDRDLIRSGGVPAPRKPAAGGTDARSQPWPSRATARPAPVRRRRRSFLRTVSMVLLFAILALGTGAILLGIRAAAFNDAVSTAGFPSTALLGSLNGSERVNVVLIGYGGPDHDGPYLADSIQVLSIDPVTDTSTTIPIPRDLWVEGIGSFPQNGKINEVFAAGVAEGGLERGGDLMAAVLSDMTGLEIDHWISIDFDGFRDMIDAVGGVTIANPVAFSYTNTGALHNAGDWSLGTFPAGEIHLDGAQALAYSRARFTSVQAESTDFARSARQARVIAALRSELGDGGVGSLLPGLRLMDAAEGNVLTDLSVIDLALLSGHLSSDRRIDVSDGTILMATTNTIGQYILIPRDWTGPGAYGGFQAYLADELARPLPAPSPSADAP